MRSTIALLAAAAIAFVHAQDDAVNLRLPARAEARRDYIKRQPRTAKIASSLFVEIAGPGPSGKAQATQAALEQLLDVKVRGV